MITVQRKGDNFVASTIVLGKKLVGDLGPTEAWALRHLEAVLRDAHHAIVDARVGAEIREGQ